MQGKELFKEETKNYIKEHISEWRGYSKDFDIPYFCELFKNKTQLLYINGNFYCLIGYIEKEELQNEIYIILNELNKEARNDISQKVKRIINNLEMICYMGSEEYKNKLKPKDNEIFTPTKLLMIDKDNISFGENRTVIQRINIEYKKGSIMKTENWNKYLKETFEEIDEVIFQEFLGYLLLSSLRARKSVCIYGKGDNGKWVILKIIEEILGRKLVHTGEHIEKIFNDRFGFAYIENKLVLVDSDLSNIELDEITMSSIRTFITDGTVQAEQKGKDRKELDITTKLLLFGNQPIRAKNDDKLQFTKRFIFIKAKDRPENYYNDHYLLDKLLEEKEGILEYMINGAIRLIKNNYHFSHEEHIKYNSELIMKERKKQIFKNFDYIKDFLSDSNYVVFDDNSITFTYEIFCQYEKWAKQRGIEPTTKTNFYKKLAEIITHFGIEKPKDVRRNNEKGKGYIGIKLI